MGCRNNDEAAEYKITNFYRLQKSIVEQNKNLKQMGKAHSKSGYSDNINLVGVPLLLTHTNTGGSPKKG
jgi:hypothetical protein